MRCKFRLEGFALSGGKKPRQGQDGLARRPGLAPTGCGELKFLASVCANALVAEGAPVCHRRQNSL